MARRLNVIFFACALFAVLGPAGNAGPVSRESVVRLTAAADAIVVGSVEATIVNGTVNATIRVERVLKGSPVGGGTLLLSWQRPDSPFLLPGVRSGSARPEREHGLCFLKEASGSGWSILPVMVGSVDWQSVIISTPADVPQDLRNAASASLPNNPSPLDYVFLELAVATDAGAPILSVDLVDAFRATRSEVLRAAFTRLRSKQDPRMLGLRGSIASGDPSSILAVKQNYATLATSGWFSRVLEEIKIYYINTQPQAIDTLGGVATDRNTPMDLRVATAGALARMHTQRSLPYLVQLLTDDNRTLKTMAVGGLASFANNVPIGSHEPAPGPWPYRTADTIAYSAFDERIIAQRESYYVGFWQNWWQQNQNRLR